MLDPGARRHALNVARLDHFAVTHAVLVLQGTTHNVGDDLHVTVRMGRKATRRSDVILVDDTQGTETHPVRVVVIAEREAVPAVQPG